MEILNYGTVEATNALNLPKTLVKVTQVKNIVQEYYELDTKEICVIKYTSPKQTMAEYFYND